MARLKNRQMQIPGGYQFTDPVTRWRARPFTSFETIVRQVMDMRRANPFLSQKHKQPTDYESVANEVEQFNVLICQKLGYKDYIEGGDAGGSAPIPFPVANQTGRLASVAGAAEPMVEFVKTKEDAVDQDTANRRAEICVKCPVNGKGDLLRFFTIPVAAAIRKAYELRNRIKLETPKDGDLGVCEACDCPLKLKVWFPIETIRGKLTSEQKGRLDSKCWILHE